MTTTKTIQQYKNNIKGIEGMIANATPADNLEMLQKTLANLKSELKYWMSKNKLAPTRIVK